MPANGLVALVVDHPELLVRKPRVEEEPKSFTAAANRRTVRYEEVADVYWQLDLQIANSVLVQAAAA